MNKTPRVAGGTGVPSTSAALSDRADVPSEYFARATAPTSARTRIAVVGPSNPSALTTLTREADGSRRRDHHRHDPAPPDPRQGDPDRGEEHDEQCEPRQHPQRFVRADREGRDDDPDDEHDRHDRGDTATGRRSSGSHSSSLATRGVGLIDMGP